MGLAHVRALVRRLGGVIQLKSTLGQGTSFIVTLPHMQHQTQKRMPA
jgi:signal transduction histidine kinase